MGLLTSLAIICALIMDFLLLPAILLALDREKVESATESVQIKDQIYGGV